MRAESPRSEADCEPEHHQIEDVLQAVSREMISSAKRCTEIQWVISDLLERAHHPNLSAEIHVLQDIDRIQQTLEDLGRLLEVTASPTKGVTLSTAELDRSLKLDSLRARLLADEDKDDRIGHPNDDGPDITWL